MAAVPAARSQSAGLVVPAGLAASRSDPARLKPAAAALHRAGAPAAWDQAAELAVTVAPAAAAFAGLAALGWAVPFHKESSDSNNPAAAFVGLAAFAAEVPVAAAAAAAAVVVAADVEPAAAAFVRPLDQTD